MADKRDDLRKAIRQRGFRVTPQRELILAAVREGGGHVTPELVFERVTRLAPSLSRATVYRTLDFLAEQHLITCTDLGVGSKVYELVDAQPHHHLVCEACGSVQQIDHTVARHFFRQVENEFRFHVTTDHLALFGLCAHCFSKKEM